MKENAALEELRPMEEDEKFQTGKDLEGIETLVSLGDGTCTMRAAQIYCDARRRFGHCLNLQSVDTFERAILAIRDDSHAAMLVPELHHMQKTLAGKPHYQNISSQSFRLHNPGLHLAAPDRNTSDRTYLWALPTLIPLVQEQYEEEMPFEEIIPAKSTQEAAMQCGKIFGGAYCVTNEEGLRRFALRSVKRLRHIDMRWFLYRKNRRGKTQIGTR